MSFISTAHKNAAVKSFAAEAVKLAKIREDQDKTISACIDDLRLNMDKPMTEFLKGNAKTNPARAEVKELFEKIAEAGGLSASAAANYQTSFWVAFEHGVPFTRDLFTKKKGAGAEGTGTAAKADKAAQKAGKVTTTTLEDAHKTMAKALAQYRMVNCTDLAGDLLDVILAAFPDFKEPATGEDAPF